MYIEHTPLRSYWDEAVRGLGGDTKPCMIRPLPTSLTFSPTILLLAVHTLATLGFFHFLEGFNLFATSGPLHVLLLNTPYRKLFPPTPSPAPSFICHASKRCFPDHQIQLSLPLLLSIRWILFIFLFILYLDLQLFICLFNLGFFPPARLQVHEVKDHVWLAHGCVPSAQHRHNTQ